MTTAIAPALRELHDAIAPFDLPSAKKVATTKSELLWLARNMGCRNASHPAFAGAMETLKGILRAI